MPCCSAINCFNRSERGFRTFRFPADELRRTKWLQNLQRKSWTPTKSSCLCEKHFEDSQFENSRADGWRKLKPNAIPTLFNHPNGSPIVHPAPKTPLNKIPEFENLPSKMCARCALNVNLSLNFGLLFVNRDLKLHQSSDNSKCKHYVQNNENNFSESTDYTDDITNNKTIENILSTKEVSLSDIANDVIEKGIEIELSKDTHINYRQNKVYKCGSCDFTTTKYKQLYYHRSTRHQIVKFAVCNICGKSLLRRNIRKHTLSHNSQPAACQVCGFVSKNSESLRGHMMYHNGPEKMCHICGKVYIHSSKYIMHIRQHTVKREKKYQCLQCNKLFNDKSTLKKHIRSHTGERPFMCEFCNKGFSSSHALKTHIRQHTKERPYACLLCPMAFPQRVSLRAHMKSKHDVCDSKSNE